MYYLIKTPWWLKKLYPSLTWNMPREEKTLYLTFDDGPHPSATPYVLEQLKKYQAKATFFCIGKNVTDYPDIYRSIIDAGQKVGNHTQNHLNAWKTNDTKYIQNVLEAAKHIDSTLFRPPYGKITKFQAKLLQKENVDLQTGKQKFRIIMWDVLSADFDDTITAEKCYQNVIKHTEPGSIIVFHDSTKAWLRMNYALPKVLEYYTEKGYSFKSLSGY